MRSLRQVVLLAVVGVLGGCAPDFQFKRGDDAAAAVLLHPDGHIGVLDGEKGFAEVDAINARVREMVRPRCVVITPDGEGILALGGDSQVVWWPRAMEPSARVEVLGEVRGFASARTLVIAGESVRLLRADGGGTELPRSLARLRFAGDSWAAISQAGHVYLGLTRDGVEFNDHTLVSGLEGACELAVATTTPHVAIDTESGLVILNVANHEVRRISESVLLGCWFSDSVPVRLKGEPGMLNLATGQVVPGGDVGRFVGWRKLGAVRGSVTTWPTFANTDFKDEFVGLGLLVLE